MKVGIITSGKDRYDVFLLYALIKSKIKPDCVIIINKPIHKRIIRNFNIEGLQEIINDFIPSKIDPMQHPPRDFFKEFAESKNISVPVISLKKACKEENVKYVRFNDSNSKKAIMYIQRANLDVAVNAGGGIYKSKIINSLTMGILNTHMAYLPEFRGMNVLEWSLLYNKEIGVTLHFIDKGIDTGDILLFKSLQSEENDSIQDLRNKSGFLNIELIIEGIERLGIGSLSRTRQNLNDGKQYFVMHPRLRQIAEERLKKNYWKST